jgi:hypothetical protein
VTHVSGDIERSSDELTRSTEIESRFARNNTSRSGVQGDGGSLRVSKSNRGEEH